MLIVGTCTSRNTPRSLTAIATTVALKGVIHTKETKQLTLAILADKVANDTGEAIARNVATEKDYKKVLKEVIRILKENS